MTKPAVLVAGGAGYIGSHVCKALANAGVLPVTLDDLSTGHASAVRYGPLIEADISSKDAVTRAVEEYSVSSVLHFAAKSLVGESISNPLKYYHENVGKGIDFLRNLQGAGLNSMLFSSTAAVYGTPEGGGVIPETAPTVPVNPYGATKLAFEEALKWSATSSGGRWAILRYFNAAGADPQSEIGEDHDPETHLIPLVIGAALGQRPPVTIYGTDYPTADGSAIRDYVHVEDLASAHVLAYRAMAAGREQQLFNVGGGTGWSVFEILNAARDHFGEMPPHVLGPRRAGDPPVLVADVSRLRSEGWTPRLSDLPSIIATAARWERLRSSEARLRSN